MLEQTADEDQDQRKERALMEADSLLDAFAPPRAYQQGNTDGIGEKANKQEHTLKGGIMDRARVQTQAPMLDPFLRECRFDGLLSTYHVQYCLRGESLGASNTVGSVLVGTVLMGTVLVFLHLCRHSLLS